MTATKTGGGGAAEELPVERALRWLRARRQAAQEDRATAAPPRPRPARLQPPRSGWWSRWWSARLAAGSGVAPEEFLRHRLSRYLAALPVSPDRLPVSIDVGAGGVLAATPRERAPSPWLEAWLRAHGSGATRSEATLAQAEVARLAAELAAQQPRLEAAERDAEEAARHPSIAEAEGASLERLGRPRVPPHWAAAVCAFAVLLLLAEAWHLAMPVLEGVGVETQDLAGAARRNPAGVALGLVFALGAAVSLFTFVDLALRRVRALFAALPAPSRARWMAATAVLGMAFAAAVSWSIAGVRPAASGVDLLYARFTLFLLALALPVTTSCLLQVARRLAARRAEAVAAALAWDQVHYRSLAVFTRKAGVAAAERRERARLEAQRDAAVRRLRALHRRAQVADRYAAEAADAERVQLERLALAVASALELDRYAFLRLASARGGAIPSARPEAPRQDRERSLGLAG